MREALTLEWQWCDEDGDVDFTSSRDVLHPISAEPTSAHGVLEYLLNMVEDCIIQFLKGKLCFILERMQNGGNILGLSGLA